MLVLLALLAAAPAAPAPSLAPPPPPRVLRLQRPAGGEWLGLFILGRKAGSSYAEVREDVFEGRRAVRSEARVHIAASVGGAAVERRFDEQRFYEWRDGGRLLGFTAHQSGDGGALSLSGTCDTGSCRVRIEAEGRVETKVVPDPGETVEYADPVRLVAEGHRELRTPFLDLVKIEASSLVTRYLGSETRILDGVAVAVVRVGTREDGETLESVAQVAVGDGRILELNTGDSMRGVAASAEEAEAGSGALDLTGLTKVRLPAPLRSGAREVTLVVTGLPPEFRRADDRQTFEDLGKGRVRVRLRSRQPRSKARPPFDRLRFQGDLAVTTAIDHDDPAVRELAIKVVPEPRGDAWRQAGQIVGWVHGSLAKVYGQSSDRASRVVTERKGDCTEHALLFAALGRAVGLPTRLVHGLVATGDEDGRALYWHEWAEVYVGEWIAVDPTFGQTVADATHLALGRGDDASAMSLLGQIQVLEASSR